MPPSPPLFIEPEFPAPLECLFKPKRYKVLFGGRGAGRSWGVARALLIQGIERTQRSLCAREFQNSIGESVHKVIADQITNLKMNYLWDVQQARIIGRQNDSYFAFEGIKNNVNRIKSYEGIERCWVEEANKVSRASWGTLIPTIRKESCPSGHQLPANMPDSMLVCPSCGETIRQSEIWITFNPELDTDYTYRRFVIEATHQETDIKRVGEMTETPSMFVVKMTYRDNPWFPRVLREEMERDRARDPDYYLNVWEGNCIQLLEGTVYARELRKAQQDGRICSVPYDAAVPVDVFFDLGRADNTALWACQKVAMQYRILKYYEASGTKIPMDDPSGGINHFLREIQSWGFVIGTVYLPHDAKARRLGSQKTIEEVIRKYYKVRVVSKQGLSDGINAARLVFGNCWFDEEGCEEGLTALRHYRYRVVDGQLSNDPLHDWASDGADAFRTFAMGMQGPRPASGLAERLAGLTRTARRERELAGEFSGRGPARAGGGLGWLGR